MRWGTLALGLVFALAGCDGVILDPAGSGGPGGGGPGGTSEPVTCEPDTVVLAGAPMRRLTNTEYFNTLEDLFGTLPEVPAQPPDAVSEGSFENQAEALGPSDVRVARWEQTAMRLGRHAVTDPAVRASVLPCEPADGADPATCGEQLVRDFGRRALRRPLEEDEVARYHAFFEEQRVAIDFDAAVELTIAAMLQSPWFLYRLEIPDPDAPAGTLVELTPHEVASRLSYFLWESMPDEPLAAAADAGELRDPAVVESHARRMLADPRARQMVRNFHRQWLHLDRVRDETKLPEVWADWNAAVAASAAEESQRFAEGVFFREGGSEGTVADLLTSPVAYLNSDVAPLYGAPAPSTGWERTELDPATRAGILTRVAFLAGNAHEANGSPPLRGIYVMERLLCEPRPSPPPDADTSPPEQPEGEGPYTNRELFEQRTADVQCQSCHTRIDGFGFGFENFDAAGVWRDLDQGYPVDATGAVSGTDNDGPFDGAVEMQARLAESTTVHDCVTEKWFAYAWGRPARRADKCHVESLQEELLASGGDLQELVVSIVTRPEFQLRPAIAEEE